MCCKMYIIAYICTVVCVKQFKKHTAKLNEYS